MAGSPAPSRPFDVATDSGGNVVAVGRVFSDDNGNDAVAIRLAEPDGEELWRVDFVGHDDADDELRAVAISGSGDAVVVGEIHNLSSDRDALIARIDRDFGTALWKREIDGGRFRDDNAMDVVLATDGDPIVVGRTVPPTGPGQIAVWRLSATDGSTKWLTLLGGGQGQGRRVIFANGDVYVAGDRTNGSLQREVVVAKLDPSTGAVAWQSVVAGSFDARDTAEALAFRAPGLVIVGSVLWGGPTGPDFVVSAARGSDGTEAWRYTLDGTTTGADEQDFVQEIDVDGAGNVFAAGRVSFVDRMDELVVVKLGGANGDEIWRTELGFAFGNDGARGIRLDSDGDVITAGRLRNVDAGTDLAVVKLAGDTGEQLWRTTFPGNRGTNDSAFSVTVDVHDNVAAAGRTRNDLPDDGFTVVTLSGDTGGILPCGNGVVDPGEACDDGNLDIDDGCLPNCTLDECGDGVLDPGEACDDGNAQIGDGCRPNCTIETCGDAVVDPGEECDDGEALPDDCCADDCTAEPDAQSCQDDNMCTTDLTCSAGRCIGGIPFDCDDNDPCSDDSCEPAAGCVYVFAIDFRAITCIFERPVIELYCPNGVPKKIVKRLEKARRLIDLAAIASVPDDVTRYLKRGLKRTRQAERVTRRKARRGKVDVECAEALLEMTSALRTSITGLQQQRAD